MTGAGPELEQLRYPVGRFDRSAHITPAEYAGFIDRIAAAPAGVRAAVAGLGEEQLDTRYRDGGWTVRQVVHHVPDSHINAYVRFRWTLTEDQPTIKAYDQAAWAELVDARTLPVQVSLDLLDAVHARWVALLRGMTESDFAREYEHPEDGPTSLATMLRLYEWHGRHHTAHITSLRERMGW